MPSTIGYARVSTTEQCLDLQRDALRRAGCDTVESDQGISGSVTHRPGLDAALAALQPGDTLCVWRLDRLGRSLPHLLETVEGLKARGVEFRSLTESIDTSTASGELIFHIFASLAQFERSLIRERVNAGVKAAQARGQHCGRPASLTPSQVAHARELREQGKSLREIGRIFRVSYMAVARAFDRQA
jgi:DNA invertase Pin-like site-specific DNA recombinase